MTKAQLVKLYVAEGCNAVEISAALNTPRWRVTAIMLRARCIASLMPVPDWIVRGNLVAVVRPGALA